MKQIWENNKKFNFTFNRRQKKKLPKNRAFTGCHIIGIMSPEIAQWKIPVLSECGIHSCCVLQTVLLSQYSEADSCHMQTPDLQHYCRA